MIRETWLVAPPISVATHTAVTCLGCSDWWMCLWITCASRRSVEVFLLTWAHVLLTLLWCCLTNLWFSWLWTCLTARDCLTVLPCRLSQPNQDYRRNCSLSCTFTVYICDIWPFIGIVNVWLPIEWCGIDGIYK